MYYSSENPSDMLVNFGMVITGSRAGTVQSHDKLKKICYHTHKFATVSFVRFRKTQEARKCLII